MPLPPAQSAVGAPALFRAAQGEAWLHDGPLILGAGLAGLAAALAAAPRATLVVSPAPLGGACASAWAQGGMAAALDPADDPDQHAADTLVAGAGLCDPEAVAVLTREGPDAVRWLAALGAPFDRDAAGAFQLSLEAAHGRARVARVGGDGAGAAIMDAVIAQARAAAHVTFWEDARAVSLLSDAEGRVRGALISRQGRLIRVIASTVILATGGVGGLYAVTTDPAEVDGSGLGLAALAGAEIQDPEMVQFHPTALALGLDPAPLATEALRGEGAVLVNAAGERFMPALDPRGDLAPRDIVARGVAAQLGRGGAFLDAREPRIRGFAHHFPAVFAACQRAGLDPARDLLPVQPAAHYHMGGVRADLAGRSSLEGLLAAGECAANGVHGANRLASNSLLEAAVFGRRAGALARDRSAVPTRPLAAAPAARLPAAERAALRQAMARAAGVARDRTGLEGLLGAILAQGERHGDAPLLVTAALIVRGALARTESRGAHVRLDHPETAAEARHTRLRHAPLDAASRRAA